MRIMPVLAPFGLMFQSSKFAHKFYATSPWGWRFLLQIHTEQDLSAVEVSNRLVSVDKQLTEVEQKGRSVEHALRDKLRESNAEKEA